jgi:hypothetical protein
MTKRLVGWWKLDGNLADSVQEEVPDAPTHSGTDTEPSYEDIGKDGSAYDFLGTGNIVTINDSAEYFNFYNLGQTVSGWVKSDTETWDGVISKHYRVEGETWTGWVIDVSGGWTHLTVRGSHGDLWGSDDDGWMFDDGWHLVTAVMDPETNTSRIYVDGKFRDESDAYVLGDAMLNDEPVAFGAETALGDIPYTGQLDDVRIWNYALDDVAVALLYTDFNPGSEICVEYPEKDVTGPDGVPDCKVDLYDFAEWASSWMECNIVPTCLP